MRIKYHFLATLISLILQIHWVNVAYSQGTSDDAYGRWASDHFGYINSSITSKSSEIWGKTADPDNDGLPNLLEYACGTDPARHNPASDCWQFSVPLAGAPEYRFPQITAYTRTDDPDLRIIAQTSNDLSIWSPLTSSIDFTQPQPVNAAVWEQSTGAVFGNLRQMRYVDRLSMVNRSHAFMRLLIVHRTVGVTTSSIEPFGFTTGQTVVVGGMARSSAITLAGFIGTISVTIPSGVTMFVNGIVQAGSNTSVKAGDTVWMEAAATGPAGVPRNYVLTIGSQSATWSFTTGSIAAVPDHPGTDSGYTPVETSVSDIGAAQISIPIAVAPGTAGMQPNLSINYSSQGGNGQLGVGFDLSAGGSITRVGRTIAHDGVNGGVNFDSNDRFALNGQRLIAIVGPDGGDRTEYRLEFDPTVRIRSFSIGADSPGYWTVENKSGLIMTYGGSATHVSRPAFDGKGVVRNEWYSPLPGTGVAALLASPNYPQNPLHTIYGDSLKGFLSNGAYYGQRVRGYLVPKISGAYQFRVTGDDEAALNFNQNGISDEGMTRISYQGSTSNGFELLAGQKYLIEALHYQWRGPQYIQVMWKGPGIEQGPNGEFTSVITSDYLQAEDYTLSEKPILSWNIASTQDTLGNTIDYLYEESQLSQGSSALTAISYVRNVNAGLTSKSRVRFEYEQRPDARSLSISNNRREGVVLDKRLKKIISEHQVGGSFRPVRSYEMDWSISRLTGRSLLLGVRESAGVSSHDTRFSWLDQPLANLEHQLITTPPRPSQWDVTKVQPADFNGDGFTDLFCIGSDGKLTVLLKNQSGGFDMVRTSANRGLNTSAHWLVDVNSDGMTDIITRLATSTTAIIVYVADGSGGFTSTESNPGVAWNSGGVATGDINGDGRTDFIAGLNTASARSYISNGDGTFSLASQTQDMTGSGLNLYQGDFNGDGRMDFVSNIPTNKWDAAYYWKIYQSNGDGTFALHEIPYSKDYGTLTGNLVVGDYNGDGLSDLAKIDGSNITTFLMDGFQIRQVKRTLHTLSSLVIRQDWVGNFNSDECADLFGWASNIGILVRFISDGNGGFIRFSQNNPSSTTSRQLYSWVGDFNGDGRSEIISDNTQITLYSLADTGVPVEDLVASVSSGHGGFHSFEYGLLTDSALHSRGDSRVYPCLDIQPASYVVSSSASVNGLETGPFVGSGNEDGLSYMRYHYEQAWTCLNGRGFMGFKAVETTDATSGIVARTVFEDRPLYAGRAKHTAQRLLTAPPGGSVVISESDTTWALTEKTQPTGRKTYLVTEASSISKSYEVNRPAASALVRTTTRSGPGAGGSVSYDSTANLLVSTTSTTDGTQTFTETVSNTYTDSVSPTKWHLGRLSTSSVTKTAPNPAGAGTMSLTRSSSFAYHPTTGLLTQEIIEPNGGTLRQQKDYTHDGFGNILTSKLTIVGDPPRTTSTTYTPDGRFVATTTNALNHTESKTYDPLLGNVLTQTGPNGLTTSWEYDAIGRPVKETRPDATVTRSFYRRVTGSTVGAPPRAVHYVRVQSSGGAPRTVWYDLLDREIRADGVAFDGRTVSSHKVFNNRGEVTHASQPYFAGDTPLYSQMLYDAVGREYLQTDPGNRITATSYNGLTTTVTNPNNQTVSSTVNAMGWTVQSTDAANKAITRSYDPYGNLRFVTDPANNTTELRYDLRGNKVWMSEPNSGTSTFTYNGFGELKTQTNNANQTVSLTYDKLGRVLTRTEPEGVTTFVYDTATKGIGQLAHESSGDFARSYFFDHLSRPVSTVESHGFHRFAVSRSYDGYGRPDAMTYPTGLATRQVYAVNGHLSEVQNAGTAQIYWRALAVNARGQITQEVQGNGVVTDRAFDAESGLIDGITSTINAAGDVQKAEFDFDLIGNLTARRDRRYSTTFSETFGYDTLNRLQTVTTTGAAAVTAAYNDLGNITSRTDVGSFSYGAASTGPHALTGVTGGDFNKSCGYDAKGNRTTDGATSLTYSSFNKPVRMVKGGDTLRFDYGPDRALYRQTTFLTQPGGATSQTVREYIGGLYERETTSEGLVRHIHYIAGGSGVTAILTDERSAASPPVRLRYIHKDHLGSVDVITDSAGAVVERQSFDAWGRRRTVAYNSGISTWSVTYPATPGSAETHRGFTGHEMLDAVGLVHMGGRIYDPITARFLSPDPFVQSPENLQNLNRYSYVLNNPLSFTDPSGFFFKSIGKFFKKHWKTIAAVAVGAVLAFVAAPALLGSFGSLAAVQGATFGFGSAFSGTLLAGGSVGDALRAGLKGGAIGGISAGAADLVGTGFSAGGRFAEYASAKPFVHGVVQGGIRQATGGKFVHGFLSGTFSDLAGSAMGIQSTVAARTAVASIVGGTAEVIGGGKFGNGAITGAFVHLFNAELHQAMNTAAPSSLVDENGRITDPDAYWKWRKELGDPMADLAMEIGNDEGFSGTFANRLLSLGATMRPSNGMSLRVGTNEWKNMRIALATAHEATVRADMVGIRGLLSADQFSGYHVNVFQNQFNISGRAFGGRIFGLPTSWTNTLSGWCSGCDAK